MIGRREFGVVGLSAVALAALEGASFAQQDRKKESGGSHHQDPYSKMLRECARACSDCQRECDSCATHCANLLAKGRKEHLGTLATCRDCADFCSAAAEIVARGGPFASLICQSCAEACARCAKECEKFPDDEHMQACAKECRKCEKACREMVKHADHSH